MDVNETEEGYFLVPKAWLLAIAEKQDRILSTLQEQSGSATAANCIGDYISEEEAKRQVGRKTTWFWNLRTSGQLPFSKIGKKIFYLKGDIKKLLEGNKKTESQENNPLLSKAA